MSHRLFMGSCPPPCWELPTGGISSARGTWIIVVWGTGGFVSQLTDKELEGHSWYHFPRASELASRGAPAGPQPSLFAAGCSFHCISPPSVSCPSKHHTCTRAHTHMCALTHTSTCICVHAGTSKHAQRADPTGTPDDPHTGAYVQVPPDVCI